jgi:serine/threonine protein kinase
MPTTTTTTTTVSSSSTDPLVPEAQIGRTINGCLVLEAVLGTGSFAVVYAARHNAAPVAAKCLFKSGLTARQLALQRVELEILQRLCHPNVVGLLALVETDQCVYLVQPRCSTDLFDAIIHSKGCFAEHHVRRLFGQLCDAVAHCHSMGKTWHLSILCSSKRILSFNFQ